MLSLPNRFLFLVIISEPYENINSLGADVAGIAKYVFAKHPNTGYSVFKGIGLIKY